MRFRRLLHRHRWTVRQIYEHYGAIWTEQDCRCGDVRTVAIANTGDLEWPLGTTKMSLSDIFTPPWVRERQ